MDFISFLILLVISIVVSAVLHYVVILHKTRTCFISLQGSIRLDLETDEIEEYNVKVLDAFYKDGSAYILIQDVATDIKRIISLFLERSVNKCPWFLIDADYLHSTLKGTENHTTMADEQELLEFDY